MALRQGRVEKVKKHIKHIFCQPCPQGPGDELDMLQNYSIFLNMTKRESNGNFDDCACFG